MSDGGSGGWPYAPGRSRHRRADPSQPAAAWRERDLLHGEVVPVGVAILATRGCRHERENGGCTMCGYGASSLAVQPEPSDLLSQFQKAQARFGSVRWVKVYNSGSFLDDDEVPPAVREGIVRSLPPEVERVTIESRPEFVRGEALDPLVEAVSDLEVAIGLESADDGVRDRCVRKGFSYADFERAAAVLEAHGAALRTYLLLKPPFLTEAEAIEDAVSSVRAVDGISRTISVNPVNVQSRTLVDRLFRSGRFRPPWLWSVAEVLKRTAGSRARVVSSPTGGGTFRGAHNCGACDKALLDAIEAVSFGGPASALDAVSCPCRELWLEGLELEPYARANRPPLDVHLSPERERSEP